MTLIRCLGCCALLSAALAAQTQIEFEVATIKPSGEQQGNQATVGIRISGSQVRVTYYTLKDYLGMAYHLPAGQINGPDWLGQERFDIAAKVPDDGSESQVPEMLQALLATRFELKAHRETKEFPVYALVVAKGGAKLHEHDPTSDEALRPGTVNVAASGSGNGVVVDLGGGSSFRLANNTLEITKANMAQVATTLTRLVDRPVVDATGLTGVYDLAADLLPDDYSATLIRAAVNAGIQMPPAALRVLDGASADPFSGPLQKLGLALESRKAPLDVVVVDSMRKTPLDN